MTEKELAESIYEKWESNITSDRRQHKLLEQHYAGLVGELFHKGVSFKAARSVLDDAIKFMRPTQQTIAITYKTSPQKKFRSKEEYAESWIKSVETIGTRIFYEYYDIEGHPGKPADAKIPASARPTKGGVQPPKGIKTDDELNTEDFWSSIKSVSAKSPWLFADEEEDK